MSTTQHSKHSSSAKDSAESTPSLQEMPNQITHRKQKEPQQNPSQRIGCIQETGTESSEFSESQSEDSKGSYVAKLEEKSEKETSKVKSQTEISEVVEKIKEIPKVQKAIEKDLEQKNEMAFNHTVEKLYQIYKKSIVKNSVKNKSDSRLEKQLDKDSEQKESYDQEQLEPIPTADQIRKGFSNIAKKLGSIALTHPHEKLPISKRTRKQIKIQRKTQLQNKKQEKMNIHKLKNRKTTNHPAEKSNSKEKEDDQSNSQAQYTTTNSVNIVDTSISRGRKMKRGLPKSNITEKHKQKRVLEKYTQKKVLEQHAQKRIEKRRQQQNDSTCQPTSCDSQCKNKQPKKIRVLQIREIQKVDKNFLEYLLNFSDGSIKVLVTDELVKHWPEEFGEYLCKKAKF